MCLLVFIFTIIIGLIGWRGNHGWLDGHWNASIDSRRLIHFPCCANGSRGGSAGASRPRPLGMSITGRLRHSAQVLTPSYKSQVFATACNRLQLPASACDGAASDWWISAAGISVESTPGLSEIYARIGQGRREMAGKCPLKVADMKIKFGFDWIHFCVSRDWVEERSKHFHPLFTFPIFF